MITVTRVRLDYSILGVDDCVDLHRWAQRFNARTDVGRCSCDGYLYPEPLDETEHTTFLPLRCDRCGYSAVLIAGRPVRRRKKHLD